VSRARKFVNPWPNAELDHRGSAFFRWQWQRIRQGVPPNPPRGTFPLATPQVAYPRADFHETRVTWLGHASFLLQIAGLNLLLDPVLSKRASPFASFGPSRFVDVPLRVDQLPPIDAVLLSHDHYDHLDERSVIALTRQFGEDLKWITPLAYREWFAKRGVHALVELDWWQTAQLGPLEITACPAQHWTRRGWHSFERLWCSYMMRAPHTSVYFAGDSGYCPVFKEIGERFGGCDIAMLPIGAYEPRWFMRASHMNPEEAVQTFLDVRAQTFVPMHWGTFRLTDEDMREPPQRLRAAWRAAQLEEHRLKLLQHGETLMLPGSAQL
jgi:N-acyl-phosphatidylethanolamine-hydrolysing phospholipase D